MTILLPRLCAPANGSVLCSDQVIASVRQLRSCFLSLTQIDSALQSHQLLLRPSLNHFVISGQVLVSNCLPVPAVTMTLQSSQVLIPQCVIHEIRADLPMPCPEATASCRGEKHSGPFRWIRISFRISRCQSHGPVSSARSPASPQG